MKINWLHSTIVCLSLLALSCGSDSNDAGVNPSGQGGSLARFAISNNNLYVVGESELFGYNLDNPAVPAFTSSYTLGIDIETIFVKGNYLYIGAETGMHIFDISDPDKLNKLSTYRHITNCDPVVVQGNIAYVTLRGGCGVSNNGNLLEIIDVSNPAAPTKLSDYTELEEPYGLGIRGDYLYVCEGNYGLKIFNVSDPYSIKLENKLTIPSYDVIMTNDARFILTGGDGIFQFDLSDPINPQLISEIPVL